MKKIMARGLIIAAAVVTIAAGNAMATPVHSDISSSNHYMDGASLATATATHIEFSISLADFGYDFTKYRMKSGAFTFIMDDDDSSDPEEYLGYMLEDLTGPLGAGVSAEIDWNTTLLVTLSDSMLSSINLGNVLSGVAWGDGGGDFNLTSLTFDGDVEPVPEPATMLLFGTGIAGLAGISRKKKKIAA